MRGLQVMAVDGLRWKMAVAAILSGIVAVASGSARSTGVANLPAAVESAPAVAVAPVAKLPSTPAPGADLSPALPRAAVALPLASTFGEPFALRHADPEGLLYTPQWAVIEEQIAADRAALASCRAEPARCPEPARRLSAIVETGRSFSGRRRLAEVNRAINLAVAYTSDRRQYGRDNVWAAPLATFASGKGDCKDYAVAKYIALLESGVPERDLRVVVVRQARASEPLHAVLTVREGGEWLVLDNRRMALLSTTEVRDYRALVAFRDTRLDLRPTLAASDDAADKAS